MRYHITSGDTEQVTEKLDKGVIDFAVLAEEPNTAKYHFLTFPEADLWGVVMKADCPLADKQAICADDLAGLPLFCSEQGWNHDIKIYLIWKKYQVFTPVAQRLLEYLKDKFEAIPS